MKHVARLTKTKQKFKFTMILEKLDLGTNISPCLGVQWSRGPRTAISKYVGGRDGIIDFGGEELTLFSTIYKIIDKKGSNSGKYEKKRSKIAIKQRLPETKKGREKRVGVIELNLSDFVGMEVEHALELPLDKCRSSSNAVLYITLRCSWINTMEQDDDAVSISQLSTISSGTTGNVYPIMDGPETPDEEINLGLGGDIADLSSLACFDEQLQKQEQEIVQTEAFEVRMGSLECENRQLRDECEDLRRRLAIQGESGFSEEWQSLMSDLKMARMELENGQTSLSEERLRHEKQVMHLKREINTLKSKSDQSTNLSSLLEEKENQIQEFMNERQNLDDEIVNEKANTAELQIELGVLRKKHEFSVASLSKVREENAKIHKEIDQQRTKYRDIMKTLHMSQNDLMRQVGFYRSQSDDLETTLMMVRKSWKDTSHIMETQIKAMNAEIIDTKLRNKTLKEKLENVIKKNISLQSEMEELNEHKTKMSEVLTKHEVKMAEKMVGLVNANNLLQAARDQNLVLQQEIDELRSGLTNNTNSEQMYINDVIPDEMLNKYDDEYSPYGRRYSEPLIEDEEEEEETMRHQNKRKASIEEEDEEHQLTSEPNTQYKKIATAAKAEENTMELQHDGHLDEDEDDDSLEVDLESFI